MKIQSTKYFSTLSREEIIDLSTELKEILVPDYKKEDTHILSSAGLWNIQRDKRVRRSRWYI